MSDGRKRFSGDDGSKRFTGDDLNTIFDGCDPWSFQVSLYYNEKYQN